MNNAGEFNSLIPPPQEQHNIYLFKLSPTKHFETPPPKNHIVCLGHVLLFVPCVSFLWKSKQKRTIADNSSCPLPLPNISIQLVFTLFRGERVALLQYKL